MRTWDAGAEHGYQPRLNGGVPATEVAERAGHSVDVLLKVYAKCIDGQRETVNNTIQGLFDQ